MSEVIFGTTVGVELCLSWRQAGGNEIPEGALDAGGGCFVIRAENAGEWFPGKLLKGEGCAYIGFDGQEHERTSYQVLVHSDTGRFGPGYTWAPVRDGELPQRALVAGSVNGHPQFVARGEYNGQVVTGRAILSSGKCKRAYIPSKGEEHALDSFDALAFNCRPE